MALSEGFATCLPRVPFSNRFFNRWIVCQRSSSYFGKRDRAAILCAESGITASRTLQE